MGDGKQAFIVLGPESSGTRLVTKLFIAAGCAGDSGHKQRFDDMLSNGEAIEEPVIVIRRSYPYAKEWPNLGKLAGRLQRSGYEVRVVVVLRSLQYTALSSVRQKHTKNVEHALRRSTEAARRIGTDLAETDLPFVWVTYEALVQRDGVMAWLFGWAGLPTPESVEIYDGNEKYD